MQLVRPRWVVLGTLTLSSLAVTAGAQRVGPEFRVNTYTAGSQRTDPFGAHLVAADASGNFVVVWHGAGAGDAYGIFGQRFNSAGARRGAEFRVNTYTTNRQVYSSVASAANGEFVVVWDSQQDGSSYGVFGQRYDSSGARLGAEFRVNSFTTSHQRFPSVAMDADGNFVVVWNSYTQDGSSYGVFGQRYDSAGQRRGAEFRANTFTNGSQRHPSIAADDGGDFVVVWGSYNQDGSAYGIFGQRYDSAGQRLGAEFRANTYTPSQQRFPSVSADADGNFVVVWNSFTQDVSAYGIFGQRYDSSGVRRGAEFRANTFTAGEQRWPSVASDRNGGFVVAWHSENQDDGNGYGIFGRRYDGAGVPQGPDFQINTYTTSYQLFPSVGTTDDENFVVAWSSFTQDGASWGIYAQRYDFGGGGGQTIHVGDLDGLGRDAEDRWRATASTLVHDGAHDPESGVRVTLNVSGGVGVRSCTTAGNGVCAINVVVPDSVESLTFRVTNLAKTGFTYVPGANHDPNEDSNGTQIVVRQPRGVAGVARHPLPQ